MGFCVGDLIRVTHKTYEPFTYETFLGMFLGREEVGQYCVRYTFLSNNGIRTVIDSRRKTRNRYEVISENLPASGLG